MFIYSLQAPALSPLYLWLGLLFNVVVLESFEQIITSTPRRPKAWPFHSPSAFFNQTTVLSLHILVLVFILVLWLAFTLPIILYYVFILLKMYYYIWNGFFYFVYVFILIFFLIIILWLFILTRSFI